MKIPRRLGEQTYILNSAATAGGINKVMIDLFNANASGTDANLKIYIHAINIGAESDVAVSGVVSALFNVFRSNTVGTGGTLHGYKGPDVTGVNISPTDSDQGALPSNVTSRLAPTGGATPIEWLNQTYVFPEETTAGITLQPLMNTLPESSFGVSLALNPGEGLVIRQGAVASVNSFFFRILFSVAKY